MLSTRKSLKLQYGLFEKKDGKTCHTNITQEKAGMSIFIRAKVNLKENYQR